LPPLVSIILPVYNHADFLPQALKAVRAQTYANWELIIVNDGSTDDFEGAVAPFLSDRRIKVLEQKNLKLPAAGIRFRVSNGLRACLPTFSPNSWTTRYAISTAAWPRFTLRSSRPASWKARY